MIRAGLALALALSAVATATYRAGPPPGYTGAFGEPDCGACHFYADRQQPAADAGAAGAKGAAAILAPDVYEPGRTYEVTVEVRWPEPAHAGFQLAARFLKGPAAGRQAGSLAPVDGRTRVQRSDAGIQYASHTAAGVPPKRGANAWVLRWTAPSDGGTVAFDVAAQVANDDDSEFGERLYRARHVSRSPAHPPSTPPTPR